MIRALIAVIFAAFAITGSLAASHISFGTYVSAAAPVGNLVSPIYFFSIGSPGVLYSSVQGSTYDNADTDIINRQVIPVSGTLTDLYVRAYSTGGILTLYKNGSATTLSCTTSSGTCNDAGPPVSVTAGDLLSFVGTTTQTSVGMKFEASSGQHQPLMTGAFVCSAATCYQPLNGANPGGALTAIGTAEIILPTDGVIDHLYVNLYNTVPSGTVVTLVKNGSDAALTCTVASSGSTCTDLSNSVSFSAGDKVVLKTTAAGGNATGGISVRWTPTTTGEAIVAYTNQGNSITNNATRYANLVYRFEASEYANIISYTSTVKKLRVDFTTAPSSGKSYAFTVRKGNGVSQSDTSVTCTISNTATSCNDASNTTTLTAGQAIDLKSVPSGTPTAPGNNWFSMVVTP